MRTHISILALAVLLTSCRTIREPQVEYRTEVSYQTEYVERLVKDTVMVEIPAQTALVVTPADSSHLETDYAVSDAWTDSIGLLHHSLSNKAHERAVEIERPERTTTTSEVKSEAKTRTITKYKDREPTWWERFRMSAFWWLVLALSVSVGWICRKPIIGALKTIIRMKP